MGDTFLGSFMCDIRVGLLLGSVVVGYLVTVGRIVVWDPPTVPRS